MNLPNLVGYIIRRYLIPAPQPHRAVYPLSSTDDAPCRSLGLSSLLALNRKSILRLRQTATMLTSFRFSFKFFVE